MEIWQLLVTWCNYIWSGCEVYAMDKERTMDKNTYSERETNGEIVTFVLYC